VVTAMWDMQGGVFRRDFIRVGGLGLLKAAG
jgi:hypothetical protein